MTLLVVAANAKTLELNPQGDTLPWLEIQRSPLVGSDMDADAGTGESCFAHVIPKGCYIPCMEEPSNFEFNCDRCCDSEANKMICKESNTRCYNDCWKKIEALVPLMVQVPADACDRGCCPLSLKQEQPVNARQAVANKS